MLLLTLDETAFPLPLPLPFTLKSGWTVDAAALLRRCARVSIVDDNQSMKEQKREAKRRSPDKRRLKARGEECKIEKRGEGGMEYDTVSEV